MKFRLACLLLTIFAGVAQAELSLHGLFSDRAVLQQGVEIPVWGKADRGAEVMVELAPATVSTRADAEGRWMVKLPVRPKSIEAAVLTVRSGEEALRRTGILVGEVWVCSGQSNMAWTAKNSELWPEVFVEARQGGFGLVRLFKKGPGASDEPLTDVREGEQWTVADPTTLAAFSATATYFARHLKGELKDTPIGLISSTVGGTNAYSWIPNETMAQDPRTAHVRDWWGPVVKAAPSARERYRKALAAWKLKVAEARKAGKKVQGRAPREPAGLKAIKRPTGLYNAMIAPLQPYAIKGAIWYQGEANSRAPFASNYEGLMTALIEGWRHDWAAGGFTTDEPFSLHTVQLPAFGSGPGWCLVREGFARTAAATPNSETAITIDSGAQKDIHPRDKHIPGKRLALIALAKDYGRSDLVWTGPAFDSMSVSDSTLELKFRHVGGGEGLASSDDAALRHFEVAGADKVFHPANAEISSDGKSVVVASKEVPEPVAVRYAWVAWPEGGVNFVGGTGLPAGPFRSDDWKIDL